MRTARCGDIRNVPRVPCTLMLPAPGLSYVGAGHAIDETTARHLAGGYFVRTVTGWVGDDLLGDV